MSFSNLKFREKLFVGFGSIIILLVIMLVIMIINLSNYSSQLEDLQKKQDSKDAIGNALNAHLKWVSTVSKTLILNKEATSLDVEKDYTKCSFGKWFYGGGRKEAEQMFPDLRDPLKNVEENHKLLHEVAILLEKSMNTSMNGQVPFSRINEIFENSIIANSEKVIPVLAEMKKLLDEHINIDMQNARHQIYTIRNSTIIISIAAILIGIMMTILITNSITKPTNKLRNIFNKVIGGDLKNKVDLNSKDEIGQMALDLNKLIDSNREQVMNLLEQSKIISHSSDSLLETSEHIAHSSAELLAQTSVAASSSEEIATNVHSVSTSSEEMTSSIREISKNTGIAAQMAKDAEESAGQANEVMNRLGISSKDIGNIVKDIKSISEQTNLLALNATIEAARAGESGKGFAVVANEVKELAKQAAKSSEDITNKIKTIQDEAANAIIVIKGIIANTKNINDISNTIASAVEEQSVTTNEVNRNLVEASKGVTSTVEVVSKISSSANEFSDRCSFIKMTANDLKIFATNLENMLKTNYSL